MKYINKFVTLLLIVFVAFTGCDDILDSESLHILKEEDYRMSETSDSLYSMVGVITQLQKLADSYVVLGELRGDLVDVTENSRQDLIDINQFNAGVDNEYADIKKYYSVINNCNYIINNIDTSFIIKSKKVLMPEFVGLKTIRAWTYLQMALNFGKVKYYSSPVLTVQEAEEVTKTDKIGMDELADLLIKDLEPYVGQKGPGVVSIDGARLGLAFPDVRLILGDLYLWRQDYEMAANLYHDYLFYKSPKFIVDDQYSAYFEAENGIVTDYVSSSWFRAVFYNENPRIFTLFSSLTEGEPSELFSMTYPDFGVGIQAPKWKTTIYGKYELAPSEVAVNNWETTNYFNDNYETSGDGRGKGSYLNESSIDPETYETFSVNYISKFYPYTTDGNYSAINLSRKSIVYLKYAEAVNRLGKPNLAFAVIKNGLSNVTLANKNIVPKHEKTVPLPNYMNFTHADFDDNIGTAMRGQAVKYYQTSVGYRDLRNAQKDTTFIIPEFIGDDAKTDSIEYVEDLIVKEMALESAFEGNRFQDLMRVAIRRNDPGYLAKKVATKHKDNQIAMEAELMNPDNWYLPSK